MRRFYLLCALACTVLFAASNAWAGPNANGVLLLHANEGITYCSDNTSYCGQAGLMTCEATDASVQGNRVFVWFVIASFPDGSSPRLSGMTFGIQYDASVSLMAQGACGDFELPTSDWPSSGSGTALTWNAPRTALLSTAYWFAGYNYYAPTPALFALKPHPTQGGSFADDSIPSILDPILGYGTLGFDQPGTVICALPHPTGACCLIDASCVLTTALECNGTYWGDGVPCDPNPCPVIGGCSKGVATGARHGESKEVGRGHGTLQSATTDLGCGVLHLNSDSSYENGYAWQYGGQVAPTYGAFAECYSGIAQVICSVVIDLTQVGLQSGQTMDVYLWNDDNGCPGSVRCVKTNVDPGQIAYWPTLSRHVVNVDACAVDGSFWVGWWGNWPGQISSWYVGADLDGIGGCPLTNIAPGIGFPTGWTNTSLVWGPTQALGIGCETIGGSEHYGACCFANGTCQTRLQAACEGAEGTYQGDGTTCSPNPCPQPPPTGACCATDGGCTVLTEAMCAAAFGSYLGDDVPCNPNPCPQPLGACCFEDGSCLELIDAACTTQGGAYQGDFTACSPNPCPQPPTGACCSHDGSCVVTTDPECAGVYQGDDTTCDPNPCPTGCVGLTAVHRENAPPSKPTPTTWPNGAGQRGAGPNASGTLILHTNPSLVYSSDIESFCGQSNLSSCENANVRVDGDGVAVIHAIAAFPIGSQPRLSGIVFGIAYGPCVALAGWGACGDFELPSGAWPNSGEGTAVTWNTAQTSTLTEIYWFAAYAVYASTDALALIPHPTQGAVFADDSIPAILDPIADLGRMGFNQDGDLPCPAALPASGACCYADGHCVVLQPASCASSGGVFMGEGESCDPNPCPAAPPTGACCRFDGFCVVTTEAECQWVYQGDATSCDPNPCPVPPPGTGACCATDGSCTITTSDDCVGSYQGDDVPCNPNPCPTGCVGLTAVHRENAPASKPVPQTWPSGGGEQRPGQNAGGTLILHSNPSLVYSSDVESYCGASNLAQCDAAITSVNGDGVAVIHVIAAFNSASQPRLAGLVFGIQYGPCVGIVDWGACGDFELSTAQWPMSGEGTAVTWNTAQTSHLTEAYWFAAYSSYGSVDRLSLVPHPTQGALFADDSVPALLDPIAALGALGFNQAGVLPCPGVTAPTGACCVPDGSCVIMLADDCVGIGGMYLGDGTTCDPNSCPTPPMGACCLGITCYVVTESDCSAQGGNFMGTDTTCDPNPCTPVGGCSKGAGTGRRSGEAKSVGLGHGTVQGAMTDLGCGVFQMNSDGSYENGYNWGYGGVIAPTYGALAECYSATQEVLCSVVLDLTQVGYQAGQRMDVYAWDDDNGCPGAVRCVKTNVDPGPVAYWPELSRHVVTMDGCDVDGSFWVGWWGNWPGELGPWYVGADLDGPGGCPLTNIAPGIGFPTGWTNTSVVWGPTQALGIGCETIGGDEHFGACCFNDGSCQTRLAASCGGAGGAYQGDGTSCDPNPCPPAGACCRPDGTCYMMMTELCAIQGGTPMGDGTTCDPNPCFDLPGACCVPTGGCQVFDFTTCTLMLGLWQGYGSSCDLVVCPPIGACCREDGTCQAILEQTCWSSGGVYQGDGTTCDPNPCPQLGACCYSDGSCAIQLENNCIGSGGSFQGGQTSCEPNPCPPAGACCRPDGSCYVTLSDLCVSGGGLPMGDGTTCDPNPCFDLPGACCVPTGECQTLPWETCESLLGLWRGYGVSCDVVVCPAVGACCFEDGTCRVYMYEPCGNAGGSYQGDGIGCSPNPCPQPGACCLLDGSCTIVLESICASQQGVFHGETTACDPNPCPQPCGMAPIVRWENAPAPLPRTASWPVGGASPTRDVGPNGGGALILHTNPALVYTDGGVDFCGQSGLARCEDAITQKEGAESAVIFALAAFPERSHPRMMGTTFGLAYGNCVVLEAWGACADFELPTAQWPASGEGTALTWNSARTTLLTEVYWFAAYAYEGRIDELALAAHPTQGAYFADDSVPAILDEVSFLGRFGFNRNGALDCPAPLPPTGGCCLMNGTCVVMTSNDCFQNHGAWYGEDVPCSAQVCVASGACCFGSACYIRTQADCMANGGTYHGDATLCSPNPCGGGGGGGCAKGPASGTRHGEAKSVGIGTGTLQGTTSGLGCGTLNMNSDGTYENGYAWQYAGIAAPTYGAFAECFSGDWSVNVCSAVFDFTQVGSQAGQQMDVYVWNDDGGCPGTVVCGPMRVTPGTIAFWPAISRHVFDLGWCCVEGNFWVGFWGVWPNALSPWYVGADLDGFGGCPLTNIAPGIGYPTGWVNTSMVWGPTQALGIGCETSSCGAIAIKKMSWGRVKSLYKGEEGSTR